MQKAYAQDVRGIQVSRERRREKIEEIAEEEDNKCKESWEGFWPVNGSRPDLAAWSSLMQQKVIRAFVSGLIKVSKLVSVAHDDRDAHIWIKSIPADHVQFVMWSDAAWSNGKDFCSPAGYMIAACDSALPSNRWGGFYNVRSRSYQQDRQTHSTLGAELLLAEARWVR